MTTIACDGKTLASDSQCTGAYIDQGSYQKVLDAGHGFYALTGSPYDFSTMVDAAEQYLSSVTYTADGQPNPPDPYHFGEYEIMSELLYMPKDQDAYMSFISDKNGMLRVAHMQYPAAAGSGSPFAMGAMVAGADAATAVDAAILLDPNSGGEVVSYSLITNEGGA